jgi:hypothetical protein
MIQPLLARIDVLALAQRYEEAGLARDRLAALLRVVLRMQRLRAFTNVSELVAAHPDGDGGWELTVVRHGRLVAAGVAPRGVPPMPQVDMLVTTAETVLPGLGPTPCASAEETERVLTWLERPATRMVRIAGEWVRPAAPASGATCSTASRRAAQAPIPSPTAATSGPSTNRREPPHNLCGHERANHWVQRAARAEPGVLMSPRRTRPHAA